MTKGRTYVTFTVIIHTKRYCRVETILKLFSCMLYPKGLRLIYLVMPKKINASLFATQFFALYAYYREALLKLWITQVQCKWIVY